MYRVAVIQNESEMLRSGYTNVIAKLRRIKRLSQYSFEMFTVVNIQKLFQEGDNHLKNFDSLVVTTNATSDKMVLSVLQENKKKIEEFTFTGKGIFVASQKKLSSTNYDPRKEDGKTNFLPDLYEFLTVERPKVEKDSGEGKISIYNNEEHILLNYPEKVTAKETKQHCEHNEFKKHFYRSHIIPFSNGSYLPIFVDTSYTEVSSRSLLMINLVPKNGERVVVSTIAIDWEFHEHLLTNVITYITEGLPKVAFIVKTNTKYGDFDFLLTRAKLSKIPHEVYEDSNKIKKELFHIHNTYIFSPDWKENDISSFLKIIQSVNKDKSYEQKSYLRVYYFKEMDNILTLAQYSNFSTIDLIIDSSVLWVNSKFEGCMWGNSFWITYDILLMMHDIGVDIESYITPITKDIKKHYAGYTYDGVIAATCGLLELLLLLQKKYKDELKKEGFTNDDCKGMVTGIIEKFNSQPLYDKQTSILTLHKYYQEIFNSITNQIEKERYSEMLHLVSNKPYSENLPIDKYSEIDLCRNISVSLLSDDKQTEIAELFESLKKSQSVSGRWTNSGRTAHVLVFLLKNFPKLKDVALADTSIDDVIYNGILYLRSQYDERNHNWDNDIQATAKAIHAIGLYNIQYKYSNQDFFKILEVESDKIYSATVIHNVSESMRKLRQQSNESILRIESLILESKKSQTEIEDNKRSIENFELYENENIKEVKRAKLIAIVSATLAIFFFIHISIRHPKAVWEEITKIDYVDVVFGFILGLILTEAAQKTILKSDLINRYKIKKKRQKLNIKK